MQVFTKLLLIIPLLLLSPSYADETTQLQTTVQHDFWIDVRSPAEYLRGHKQDAINIPHTEIASRITEVTTDKQSVIRLYCAAGVRAGIAKSILEEQGYLNVSNEGGLANVK